MTKQDEIKNYIFQKLQLTERYTMHCIFNGVDRFIKVENTTDRQVSFGQVDNPLWCSNSITLLGGDPNGMEYICQSCLYRTFDYSKVVKI